MICCFIFSYHHSVRSFSCFLYCENSLSREIVQQKNISLAFFLLSAEKFIKISTFWKYHKYSSFSYASFLFLTFSAKKSFFFFFSALKGWRRIIVFFNNRNFRLNCLRIHQILWLVEGKNYSRLRRLNSTIFFFLRYRAIDKSFKTSLNSTKFPFYFSFFRVFNFLLFPYLSHNFCFSSKTSSTSRLLKIFRISFYRANRGGEKLFNIIYTDFCCE